MDNTFELARRVGLLKGMLENKNKGLGMAMEIGQTANQQFQRNRDYDFRKKETERREKSDLLTEMRGRKEREERSAIEQEQQERHFAASQAAQAQHHTDLQAERAADNERIERLAGQRFDERSSVRTEADARREENEEQELDRQASSLAARMYQPGVPLPAPPPDDSDPDKTEKWNEFLRKKSAVRKVLQEERRARGGKGGEGGSGVPENEKGGGGAADSRDTFQAPAEGSEDGDDPGPITDDELPGSRQSLKNDILRPVIQTLTKTVEVPGRLIGPHYQAVVNAIKKGTGFLEENILNKQYFPLTQHVEDADRVINAPQELVARLGEKAKEVTGEGLAGDVVNLASAGGQLYAGAKTSIPLFEQLVPPAAKAAFNAEQGVRKWNVERKFTPEVIERLQGERVSIGQGVKPIELKKKIAEGREQIIPPTDKSRYEPTSQNLGKQRVEALFDKVVQEKLSEGMMPDDAAEHARFAILNEYGYGNENVLSSIRDYKYRSRPVSEFPNLPEAKVIEKNKLLNELEKLYTIESSDRKRILNEESYISIETQSQSRRRHNRIIAIENRLIMLHNMKIEEIEAFINSKLTPIIGETKEIKNLPPEIVEKSQKPFDIKDQATIERLKLQITKNEKRIEELSVNTDSPLIEQEEFFKLNKDLQKDYKQLKKILTNKELTEFNNYLYLEITYPAILAQRKKPLKIKDIPQGLTVKSIHPEDPLRINLEKIVRKEPINLEDTPPNDLLAIQKDLIQERDRLVEDFNNAKFTGQKQKIQEDINYINEQLQTIAFTLKKANYPEAVQPLERSIAPALQDDTKNILKGMMKSDPAALRIRPSQFGGTSLPHDILKLIKSKIKNIKEGVTKRPDLVKQHREAAFNAANAIKDDIRQIITKPRLNQLERMQIRKMVKDLYDLDSYAPKDIMHGLARRKLLPPEDVARLNKQRQKQLEETFIERRGYPPAQGSIEGREITGHGRPSMYREIFNKAKLSKRKDRGWMLLGDSEAARKNLAKKVDLHDPNSIVAAYESEKILRSLQLEEKKAKKQSNKDLFGDALDEATEDIIDSQVKKKVENIGALRARIAGTPLRTNHPELLKEPIFADVVTKLEQLRLKETGDIVGGLVSSARHALPQAVAFIREPYAAMQEAIAVDNNFINDFIKKHPQLDATIHSNPELVTWYSQKVLETIEAGKQILKEKEKGAFIKPDILKNIITEADITGNPISFMANLKEKQKGLDPDAIDQYIKQNINPEDFAETLKHFVYIMNRKKSLEPMIVKIDNAMYPTLKTDVQKWYYNNMWRDDILGRPIALEKLKDFAVHYINSLPKSIATDSLKKIINARIPLLGHGTQAWINLHNLYAYNVIGLNPSTVLMDTFSGTIHNLAQLEVGGTLRGAARLIKEEGGVLKSLKFEGKTEAILRKQGIRYIESEKKSFLRSIRDAVLFGADKWAIRKTQGIAYWGEYERALKLLGDEKKAKIAAIENTIANQATEVALENSPLWNDPFFRTHFQFQKQRFQVFENTFNALNEESFAGRALKGEPGPLMRQAVWTAALIYGLGKLGFASAERMLDYAPGLSQVQGMGVEADESFFVTNLYHAIVSALGDEKTYEDEERLQATLKFIENLNPTGGTGFARKIMAAIKERQRKGVQVARKESTILGTIGVALGLKDDLEKPTVFPDVSATETARRIILPPTKIQQKQREYGRARGIIDPEERAIKKGSILEELERQ